MGDNNNKKKNEEPSSPWELLGAAAALAGGAFLAYKGISALSNSGGSSKPPSGPPLEGPSRPPLKVLIADNATKCRDLISVIKKHAQEYCVLGFDTEYVNHYQGREPVALLQLCTHQGLCVLFPFRLLGGVPVELYDLLGERSILKVGVSPYNDAKLLWDDYKLKVNGHLDLRHLARRLPEYTRGRLQDLTETFLGILPDSDASYITMSDWNATVLSPEQIDYAAKDAYYSIEVFKVVYNKNFNDSDPSNEEILDNCGPYINRTFP